MKSKNTRRLITGECWSNTVRVTTVLRRACQIFRRDFMEIGNIDVFLEAVTIASACNKWFRKQFLKPGTIDLIPVGGYSCNKNYSKTALMWVLHMEQVDGCRIMHARMGENTYYQIYRITA